MVSQTWVIHHCPYHLLFNFNFNLFILSKRERAGEGQRERGRERIPSRLSAVSAEPDAGLEPTNCEIMT